MAEPNWAERTDPDASTLSEPVVEVFWIAPVAAKAGVASRRLVVSPNVRKRMISLICAVGCTDQTTCDKPY